MWRWVSHYLKVWSEYFVLRGNYSQCYHQLLLRKCWKLVALMHCHIPKSLSLSTFYRFLWWSQVECLSLFFQPVHSLEYQVLGLFIHFKCCKSKLLCQWQCISFHWFHHLLWNHRFCEGCYRYCLNFKNSWLKRCQCEFLHDKWSNSCV